MRRIIGAAFVSLDGVIQGPGGPNEDPTGGFDQGGWVFKLWDDDVGEEIGGLFGRDYDLLLGRRTYDIFASYWPYVEGEEAAMGEAFTKANKYVLTRGDQPLDWANSQRMTGVEAVAEVKQGDGPDLIIQGSGTIYDPLLAAGLIDELKLMIFPLTLGRGKRLFSEATSTGLLEMTGHKITAKGTAIVTYRPVGALPPYPAEAPEPSTSARESTRQQRMKEGTW